MTEALLRHVHDTEVVDFYRTILQREPDKDGHSYYVSLAHQGISLLDMYKSFTGSEEWRAMPAEHQDTSKADFAEKFSISRTLPSDISWFHSVMLPDGSVTPGHKSLDTLSFEADRIFNFDLAGKSVLDVGAWDGFFSFEAEKRGAKSVLSTDHFSWSGPGWGTKAGYDELHAALGSSAASCDVDVPNLDPKVHGTFDVVLFLGVFYHLKDPFAGLERVAELADEVLIIETETVFNYLDEPVMRYYQGSEMNNDDTNFWAPNLECIKRMVADLGFDRCEFQQNYPPSGEEHSVLDGSANFRYFAHAWR